MQVDVYTQWTHIQECPFYRSVSVTIRVLYRVNGCRPCLWCKLGCDYTHRRSGRVARRPPEHRHSILTIKLVYIMRWPSKECPHTLVSLYSDGNTSTARFTSSGPLTPCRRRMTGDACTRHTLWPCSDITHSKSILLFKVKVLSNFVNS